MASERHPQSAPTRPRRASESELRERFDQLKREWAADVAGYSTIHHKVAHPAFLAILALGPDVLPSCSVSSPRTEGIGCPPSGRSLERAPFRKRSGAT